jgi:hypothetical protein
LYIISPTTADKLLRWTVVSLGINKPLFIDDTSNIADGSAGALFSLIATPIELKLPVPVVFVTKVIHGSLHILPS